MLRTVEITRYTGEKELAKFHRWIQESTQEATAAWALVERKSGKMEMIGSDKLRFIGDSIDAVKVNAAIALRVPMSGCEEIDEMIRAARLADMMQAALAGALLVDAHSRPATAGDEAYSAADSALQALGGDWVKQ